MVGEAEYKSIGHRFEYTLAPFVRSVETLHTFSSKSKHVSVHPVIKRDTIA